MAKLDWDKNSAPVRAIEGVVGAACLLVSIPVGLANGTIPMFMSSMRDGYADGQILRPDQHAFLETIVEVAAWSRIIVIVTIFASAALIVRPHYHVIATLSTCIPHAYLLWNWVQLLGIDLTDIFIIAQRASIIYNSIFLGLLAVLVILFALRVRIARRSA